MVEVGQEIPAVEKLVSQAQIERYAAASGDFNPIHVDPDFAATSQFGGTIAHGMMVAASISEAMASAFKRHWLEGGRLKIRFKAPVRPGDSVTAFGQVKSIRDRGDVSEVVCSVGVRKQDGEVAISGEATVLLPGG